MSVINRQFRPPRPELKLREDIVPGFATFPETLLKLFGGENVGKLVLKVAED